MSYSWRSAEEYGSAKYPGVRYKVLKMSMARRLDLTRRVKDLMKNLEFLNAGTTATDKVDAAILSGEMDRLYWDFGLESIDGLDINGETTTPAGQFDRGPEELSREILQRIKQNLQLGPDEQKN
jgi:hypothetical protein